MQEFNTQLKNKIMRRVYYTYALRMVTHPVTVHGAVIATCLFVMSYFVSYVDVFRNIMHVELGNVVPYILGSLMKTEVWTLLLLGVIIFASLHLRWRIQMPRMEHA